MGAAQSTPPPPPPPPSHPSSGTPPPGCPMHQPSASDSPPPSGPLNPLNNIPDLAQAPSPGQRTFLPLERTISSIPRASPSGSDAAGPSACPVNHGGRKEEEVKQWEYPSPQQFYNALVRKGWETPEESIEMMVNIHNWLNEAAWQQVRLWEEKHPGGDRASLASFQGRPQDLSPKARFHLFMGRFFPNHYGYVRPFDRHDWIVHRPAEAHSSPSASQAYTSHRYVIDYYSLPNDEEGYPVFSLDVRPALDSPAAVGERLQYWWKVKQEAWSGAAGEQAGTPGARFPNGEMRWTLLVVALSASSTTNALRHDWNLVQRQAVTSTTTTSAASTATATAAVTPVTGYGLKTGTTFAPDSGFAFGFHIDWVAGDQPQTLNERLGKNASIIGGYIHLNTTNQTYWEMDDQLNGGILELASTSVYSPAVIPQFSLDQWTTNMTTTLAAKMKSLNDQGITVWLRFAYEMNGNWMDYGQQGDLYISVWQEVYTAVKAAAPSTYIMWAPNIFPTTTGTDLQRYSLYYPGAAYVDLAGLSFYTLGANQVDNDTPNATYFSSNFQSFYDLYGAAHPIVIAETSAPEHYYVPTEFEDLPEDSELPGGADAVNFTALTPASGTSPSELSLKSTWFEELASADTKAMFPNIVAIVWFNYDYRAVKTANDTITNYFRQQIGNETAFQISLNPPPARFEATMTSLDSSREESPEAGLLTPTLSESYSTMKRNLSFKSLREIEARQIGGAVWRKGGREPTARRYRPRNLDELLNYALSGGARSFLLGWGLRAGVNLVVVSLRITKKRGIARFGRTEIWHAALAGGVSGMAVWAEKPSRRVTISQQLLVRGLQGNYNIAHKLGYVNIPNGDALLFGAACGQIMYAWLMAPDTLAPGYRKFITNASGVCPPCLPVNLSTTRHGEFDPVIARQALTWKKKPTSLNATLIEAYAARGEAGDFGDRFAPCEVVHPWIENCRWVAVDRWQSVFRLMFPVYGALHVIPPILLRHRAFRKAPIKVLKKSIFGTLRSCSFLASFVVLFQGLVCSQRNVYYFLQGKVPQWLLEKVLLHKLYYWGVGFSTMLTLFIEEKKRRGELAMYVLPRALESLWGVLRARAWVPLIPGGEVLLASVGMAMVMSTYEHEPKMLSGLVRSILWQFVEHG
ncbi:peroxisomal membrane protein 4 [Pseudohyphozyma bogoriensis]|nr:peroxisomal membrane protein 4 [Pseudohyphozyma bogoriensis]